MLINHKYNTMSTLNRALRSLQMIKFASRPGFYALSFLDPEADAYDAVKKEIIDKRNSLSDTWNRTTNEYTIGGHTIPAGVADAAINNALRENEDLARQRRDDVFVPYLTGGGIGAAVGGTGGYFGGGWLAKKLGYGDVGQRNGKIIGATAGALLGGAVGSNIAGNWYVNSEHHNDINDGTHALEGLNSEINTLLGTGDTNRVTFVDTGVAHNARANALKR